MVRIKGLKNEEKYAFGKITDIDGTIYLAKEI